MKKCCFLLLLLGFSRSLLFSQGSTLVLDSLIRVIGSKGEDTTKALLLHGVAWQYRNLGEYELAKKYEDACLALSKKLYYKFGIGLAYNTLGVISMDRSNYPDALENYRLAAAMREEIGDKRGLAASLSNMGIIYQNQGNFSKALEQYTAAQKIQKQIGYKEGLGATCNNIGDILRHQGNYPEALKMYLESLRIFEELKIRNNIATCYQSIGKLYEIQGNYTEARKQYETSLQVAEESHDKRVIAYACIHLGTLQKIAGHFMPAMENFHKALALFQEIGHKRGEAQSYSYIGGLYNLQSLFPEAMQNQLASLRIFEGIRDRERLAEIHINTGQTLLNWALASTADSAAARLKQALQFFTNGLAIAREIRSMDYTRDAYYGLAGAYRTMQDYQKALEYHTAYVLLKDSLFNNESTRKLEQQRTRYEVEKAISEEKATQEKRLAEQEFKNARELAEKNARHQLELAEERLKKEKAVELEKLRFELALAGEHAEQERVLAFQQLENEKKLAAENARHQQAMAEEKISQQLKDATAVTLLEKEKSAKKRRTESYLAGLIGLGLISFFSIIIIRQRNEKKSALEKAEAAHKMTALELQSLRAQLNPHFMFNSLNAIQDLIVNEQSEQSQLYLARFSKLLRLLLDNASQPFVTVQQELELLELYLSLEKLRIPNLEYTIEKDPRLDASSRMIPNMMLQPYIENAIWHGLSHKKGDRKLQVRIRENITATSFEVEDNGIGRKRSAELKQQFRHGHHSRGMQLLSKRFELLSKEYGAEIHTDIRDLENNGESKGTLIKIDVPFSLSEKAKQQLYDTHHYN